MTRLLLGLLAFGTMSLVLSGQPGQEDKKKDAKDKKFVERILGTWVIESGEMAGMEPPEAFAKVFKLKFEKEGKFTVDVPDQQIEGEYKINENAKPTEIDISHDGEERKGIIKVEDGKVHLCVSEPGGARPDKFESKGDSQAIFLVLKREKK